MSAGDWKRMLVAAESGDLDQVKFYVSEGVNPNYQHPELLTTPLIESIANEKFEVVKFLIENGADPNLKAGFSSESPMKVAKRTRNRQIIQLVQSNINKNSFVQKRISGVFYKIKAFMKSR